MIGNSLGRLDPMEPKQFNNPVGFEVIVTYCSHSKSLAGFAGQKKVGKASQVTPKVWAGITWYNPHAVILTPNSQDSPGIPSDMDNLT
jgi:hypothetical protein